MPGTAPDRDVTRSVGMWSASLTAALAVAWGLAMVAQNVLSPTPESGAAEYARTFEPIHMLNLYPSILLPIPYLGLVVAMMLRAPRERLAYAYLAFGLALVYATLASTNYLIQLLAVQPSLLADSTDGLDMLVMSNPRGIFGALAASYIYRSVSLFFLALLLEAGPATKWTRWLLFAGSACAPLQVAFYVSGVLALAAVGGLLWIIALTAASILLARSFREAGTTVRGGDGAQGSRT